VIQGVDRALEEFFRAQVPLSPQAVDISFQPPDKTWGAGLTRPTVNVFLWEISRNPGYLKTGMQQRVSPDGDIQRKRADPIVDLGYLVTAWASELRDEHQLLGTVLECVLRNPVLPPEVLPERFAGSRCGLSLASAERRVPGDFWSALDGRLKPGLQIQVTLPVDVFAWQGTAAQPERIELNTRDGVPAPDRVARLQGAPRQPGAAGSDGAPRRRRANGSLVMEGRPEPDATRGG